ncbi:SusC/RagA family TonB-linked outer membrane protein [Flagellimonas onchidii]|uniref:SusC/RagA family TonB-linked outer membrane protein n=1 Tax=Flagellimonas onchidii TaxID=2562684 RepID=UPI0010A5FE20|nr:SusC/RagA family TonB-linked outer membrane protein [Allomuricauda onchidii]
MITKNFWLALMLFSCVFSTALAQEKNVSGTVTDQNGLPLPGVNIVVDGTTNGTQTDFDGNYTISASQGQTLIFSYIGQKDAQRVVGTTSIINVQMEEDTQTLEEVIVVAYGTQKKEEIAGSVATLKTDDLAQIQTSNITQGLSGKVSGVQIINNTGQPGDAPLVRFRGIGSINSSSEPLYVVDGNVFNGQITSIASQDIESMTFLKDASANALYGSRGANGVIIITTKKGKKEGIEITIDSKAGFNRRAVPQYDLIEGPGQYYEAWFNAWRLALINSGATQEDAAAEAAAGLISGGDYSLNYNSYNVPDDQVIDPATGRLNPNANLLYYDDWEDAAFRTGSRIENYISVNASSEKSRTFLSLGQLKDEGFAINSGFERITGRLSSDYTPNNWLNVGGNVNYAHTSQDSPIQGLGSGTLSNLFGWVRNVAPIYPIFGRNADGSLIFDETGNPVYDYGSPADQAPGQRPSFVANTNAIATTLLGSEENIYDNISARAYAKFSFLKYFDFIYNVSADVTLGNFTQYDTPEGGSAESVNGRVTARSNRGITFTNQQLLNWHRDLGPHSLAILLGHESYDYNFRILGGQKTQTVINQLPVLDNAVAIEEAFGYQKDYNVEGYFSRLNYSYKDKYFVNASFRRDGTSVFSPDNKWGNFYGLGAAWSVHKEGFMDNLSWMNTLRLKASTGQQGNDAILYEDDRRRTPGDRDRRNYYAYADQFDVINAGDDVPGITFFQLGNPDLVWETSTNTNAGIELGLFSNRLSINAEYFKREVEDLLFFNPIADSEGVGSIPENIGDMENNGIEVEISGDIIRSDSFNWSLSLNGTHYKNEITRLPDEFIRDGGIRALQVGESRYAYYTREWAGVDAENGNATWTQYFDDANGNGELDTDDTVIQDLSPYLNSNPNATIGETTTDNANTATQFFVGKSAIPDLFGGFSTRFDYKGFDLNVGFSYQIGGYGFDGVYQGLLSASSPGSNMHADVLTQTWTPENTTAPLPRIDTVDITQNNNSTLFLVDASYLSLNDITFGYNFGKSILDPLGIQSLRIYATASNVALWTKARTGYDPRLSITGLSINEYSLGSSTSLGLTVKF